MDVYCAVSSRRSVRGFLDTRVPDDALTRVLAAALRAPSGGNLQPWHVYVLRGPTLDDLKVRIAARIRAGDSGDPLEVAPYPAGLPTPYAERLTDMGARRYGALGIAHEDAEARARVRARNWQCFGAPVALLCYLDRRMLPPQWMDTGAFLQTVMLLLKTEGLDSCAQIAWAEYHRTVVDVVQPPAEHMLACGMSIGYADPDEPKPDIPRAALHEVVTFIGGTRPHDLTSPMS